MKYLIGIGLALAVFSLPAAAQSDGTPVDTQTVVGTPRSSGPMGSSNSYQRPVTTVDPGLPTGAAPAESLEPRASSPSSPREPVSGTGGRKDGGKFPWWILLLVGGVAAFAAN